MKHSDFLLLARAVAKDTKAQGFPHTSDAMRRTIDAFLTASDSALKTNRDSAQNENVAGQN